MEFRGGFGMTWRVRRASLHDLDALAALCRASVGPDDYVLHYLEWELLHSVVRVALDDDGRIVGMAVYRPCIDGSGWLAMARTHPNHRREGVNRAILDTMVGMARTSRVPFLRLWTDASNADGVAAFRASGFREVARFARVHGPSARGTLRAGPRSFDEDLARQVESSPIVRDGRGYVAHDWGFVPATRSTVFAVAARGALRAWGRNLIAVPDMRGHDIPDLLEVRLWAGEPEALFEEACRQAAAAGRSQVGTYIPHARDLLQGARRAGFETIDWGAEAILCELAVPPSEIRKRTRPTYGELAAKRGGHTHGNTHGNDALGWARWNR